jgi:hypothetical protein
MVAQSNQYHEVVLMIRVYDLLQVGHDDEVVDDSSSPLNVG